MTEGDGPGESTGDTDRSPTRIVEDVDRPVLLFDGVCNLCNASIRAIVRLDAEGTILFAPLKSEVGTELLEQAGMDTDYFESVVLVERESSGDWTAYTKSTAILRVCRYLDGPAPLLYPLVYLPERPRNWAYDLVAEYRYQVFGKQDECPVPPAHVRERFLERSLG